MQILESTHTIPDDVRKATIFVSEFFTTNGYRNWEYLDLASRNLVKDANRPNLGLATTKQLLEELEARAIMGGYAEYRPCQPR